MLNAMYTHPLMMWGSTPHSTHEKFWFGRQKECLQTEEHKTAHSRHLSHLHPSTLSTLCPGRDISESSTATAGIGSTQEPPREQIFPTMFCEHALPFRSHPLVVVFIAQHYNDSLCYKLFQDQGIGPCIETHGATMKISKSVNKWSSFGRNWAQRAATKPHSAEQQGIGATAWTWK